MIKLTIVRQSLETNPNVVIAKVHDRGYSFNPNNLNHIVEFLVAPKKGLYTADGLQVFMMGLIPKGLEPTCIDDFYQSNKKTDLCLGRLYFDEQIGQERITRICILTDEELLNDERLLKVFEFVNGQKTIEETEPYQRRIFVRPFPNESLVRDYLEERSGFGFRVTPKELRRYQPQQNILQRLLR